MASEQEPKLPLRLWVDEEKHRVVVAEASGDLIDVLFSFLTLPLGTIIRLVSKNQLHDQPVEIGCINNLYKNVESFSDEVESLSDKVFWNRICRRMLLCPRNPCESLCQKLKLKVDDSEPTKYFMCGSTRGRNDCLLSTFAGASCSCGEPMDKEMKLHGDSKEETQGDGVFVKGGTTYLIFDDLKVLPNSPGSLVQRLLQHGYKNIHELKEIPKDVCLEGILDLLKQALISKSPLTDVFMRNGESKRMHACLPKHGPKSEYWTSNRINLKVTLRKSKKTILYAETEGDFVDFLFSFLTTPLGSILKLLNGNSSLGCMDNLYNTMKDLNPSWFTGAYDSPLLDPRVAPQFGCRKQPLKLCEGNTPSYWYGTGVIENNICHLIEDGVISKIKSMVQNPGPMKLYDPRSPDGTRESATGFVRRPSLFVVWDDLQVKPVANTSSISFLQKLKVPLDDLEEHVVTIEETEALNLLGASLTSKAALTEGLSYLLKKPKALQIF